MDVNTNAIGLAALSPTFFILITIWALIWKGLALWRSSKNNQKYWFVALLVLNTLGLAEIIYLSFFQKSGRIKIKDIKKGLNKIFIKK